MRYCPDLPRWTIEAMWQSCPHCGVPAGTLCETEWGDPISPKRMHKARREIGERLAAPAAEGDEAGRLSVVGR